MSAWHAASAHVSFLTFVAHSYGKRAKTAELTANLPFGEFFRGRFAKQLC